MSEQQRVIVAVLSCLGILLGWQLLVQEFSPPPEKASSAGQTAGRQELGQGGGAEGSPDARSEGLTAAGDAQSPQADANAPGVDSARADGAAGAAPAQPSPSPVLIPVTTEPFETAYVRGEITSLRAALTKADLVRYDERLEEGGARRPVSLIPRGPDEVGQAQVFLELDGTEVERYELAKSASGFELVAESPGASAQISVRPRAQEYALEYTVRVSNQGVATLPVNAMVRLSLGWTPGEQSLFAPPTDQLFGLCANAEGVERKLGSDLVEDGEFRLEEPALWSGLDRQYFVVSMVPAQGATGSCQARAKAETLTVDFTFEAAEVASGAEWSRSFVVFLGPKRADDLAKVSPLLDDAVDYNIWGIPLAFMARPMIFLLNVFHGFSGSWGLAIVLLTLVVKLVLFPVTYRSVLSMRKMQLLKPELDGLKTKYANDRERQQMEQLKLFREKGVNPLGGCLPMLLQMPVWLALYRSLWTAVDLYQQPFLWLNDLTAKEPFPILALVLGGVTFLQQKITPMATDSQQAKMMLFVMPVMLTVFMIALPSGLVLYILVNSVLTIVQQLAINRRQITL